MKKFEEPKLNLEQLDVEDVIAASPDTCDDDGCYLTPCIGD